MTEEVEKTLNLDQFKGADGLNSEYLLYGGMSVTLAFEEVPSCLKEGGVVPVYKGNAKSTRSYCSITLQCHLL